LHEKQLLLLLDNFEHLIAGAGIVANILAGAPDVKILATSRKRLRLQAEWTIEVTGLPVPENGRLEVVGTYGSVELFLQSARRVQPGFDPSPEDLRAIVDVCKLVDGMPLALELAAAWVKTLSCQEIAAEIEQDLDLLETEMRDVPQRQRSVRAVFEHSWNDLSEAEQAAFKKLSVFRGGLKRSAAQEVTGATLRIVSELINKSLVSRDDTGRYQVHELLRQYAAEKLDEDEQESQATKERHAAYFSGFLKAFEEALIRGARIGPIEEINEELDNVLLAWRWAIEHKSLSRLEESMRSLFWFYEAKAWYSEGEEAFRSAADTFRATGKSAALEDDRLKLPVVSLRVRQAWFTARLSRYKDAQNLLRTYVKSGDEPLFSTEDLESGWVAAGTQTNTLYGIGDYVTARRNLEQYDELLERKYNYSHSWPWSKAHSIANLGRIAGALGDYEQARTLLQDGVDILRPLEDQVGIMLYLHTLGGVVRILGDREYARRLFQESLDLAEEHSYPMGEALALSDLGDLAYAEGEYATAKDHFEASLALSEEIGDRRGRALALANLGRVATALGEYDEAKRLYEQGLDITRQSGNRRGMAITLNRLSKVHQLLGELDQAAELCLESLTICQELGYRKGIILALISRGEMALEKEDFLAAEKDFQESLAASESVGFVSGKVRGLAGLGRASLGMGELGLAEKRLRKALFVANESDMPRVELNALVTLAETMIVSGVLDQGVELLALAAEHPAADQHTRDQAAEDLEGLRDKFSPAEFESLVQRGQAQTLEAVLETQLGAD
jgi:predicted ATPase